MTIYRLHYFPESGNSYKLALMLTLCGQDFEPVWTDFAGGATRTAEWRRDVNPMGEIPVLEIDGKRRSLGMGQSISVAASSTGGRAQATLAADARGHFMATGQINGQSVHFLVDTGASMISMNASEAKRLGVNFLKGQRGYAQTANGPATVYKVRLDTVRVGDISMSDVDALVHDGNALPLVLLGMSFLNRVEMRRDGPTMTLIKRY